MQTKKQNKEMINISQTFSKIYVKYIIKSSAIFYTFLAIGIIGFLIMSMSLKLDVTKKYEAYFDNNRIIINETLDNIDSLYVYKTLNDKVYFFYVRELIYDEQYTILYLENDNENVKNNLLGIVKIELITGQESLLKTIFVKAGNKDDD